MSDNSYEEYKKELSRSLKDKENSRSGKILLIVGACLLVYLLFILPFNAGNVSELRGDEVKAGKEYHRIQVYYIDKLHILRARTDTDDIYCIAKFLDRDGKEWILCFTPGNDEKLAERIRLTSTFENEFDITVSGYFQLGYLEDLPSAADSFFTVYASKYADAEGSNMLSMNAEFLCERYENYTLTVLCRRGIPLRSFVTGLISVLYGGFLLVRNRKRKTE